MIEFSKHILENGLTVILHRDESTPLAAVNILYKVGSRHEHPDMTGFAHLFEHLMFGGSLNVPDYDIPIQAAGGDNNAFTNNDVTNFYNILPKENLETALWLESDRMMQLNIDQRVLDIQKKVVLEEFNETSINRPYGNLWHVLSGTAYSHHPYRWPTIGLEKKHIEEALLEDVNDFYRRHYRPDNAVLVVAGNIEISETLKSIERWFSMIPAGKKGEEDSGETGWVEPIQEELRVKILEENVPSEALYMAFHMPERLHRDFAAYDVISDILSGGRSARFYKNLLKGSQVFSTASAYITGTVDPGLFIIESKLMKGQKLDEARRLIWKELNDLIENPVGEDELQKVKNGLISSISFSEVSIVHKAINLAYYEMLGDAELINKQESDYINVYPEDIMRIAGSIFRETNCSEVIYTSRPN